MNSFARMMGILGMLAGIGVAVFWMVVGWRAMRAHEKLAESASEAVRRLRGGP